MVKIKIPFYIIDFFFITLVLDEVDLIYNNLHPRGWQTSVGYLSNEVVIYGRIKICVNLYVWYVSLFLQWLILLKEGDWDAKRIIFPATRMVDPRNKKS